jgi:large subunit ribosomal protein L5
MSGADGDGNRNKMKEIKVEKVVVNIGVGEAGERLSRAEKVIKLITDHQPTKTLSKTTNRDLGVRVGMPVGLKVTLRDKDAMDFLKRAFWVKQNKIMEYSFDREGNFSFGISDYTDFEGMKYDPDIGIFGLDVNVTLARAGKRVAQRRRAKGRIPHSHRITREESYDYLKENFQVEVVPE